MLKSIGREESGEGDGFVGSSRMVGRVGGQWKGERAGERSDEGTEGKERTLKGKGGGGRRRTHRLPNGR